ncbi:hypothetical protein LB517_28135 [Mesorhizobium sp. BR1-1-12]|uniref:hypothetical protein n=1 Tax=Mesorhizobium sp. BR1-1-12 TaxID=2876657 RepID=UPI001CD08F6D|nr:hypothetical protein [Mesorhizobium sp. BR1-1-12]MBZ9973503.1 hypothetical protein [Mesorhizobium sp. BR1-1-12]
MLIKMLVGLSGSAYSLGPGDERDFPQDEALRLISAGFAVPVAEEKIERAVAVPVAAEKRGRRGKNVVHANGDGSAD